MASPLSGKLALVTGASRGIGEAIVRELASQGAKVVLAARSQAAIEKIAKDVGGVAQTLDVTDSKAVDRVVEALGPLDIVVNNAGLSERGSLRTGGDEWFERALKVNLTGTFFVSRAALRQMREGGRIVNIASVLGVFGVADSGAYVAAKHGVIGLTRALAAEVARKGITVNAVCPGWVDTAMADAGFATIAGSTKTTKEEARARALSMVPEGRILEPAEIAGLVAYLCQPEARGVHGQAIRIDGGATPW